MSLNKLHIPQLGQWRASVHLGCLLRCTEFEFTKFSRSWNLSQTLHSLQMFD